MAPKREPRAFRELRALMPWNWDARVDVCPPGQASLRDFTEVYKSCDPLAAKEMDDAADHAHAQRSAAKRAPPRQDGEGAAGTHAHPKPVFKKAKPAADMRASPAPHRLSNVSSLIKENLEPAGPSPGSPKRPTMAHSPAPPTAATSDSLKEGASHFPDSKQRYDKRSSMHSVGASACVSATTNDAGVVAASSPVALPTPAAPTPAGVDVSRAVTSGRLHNAAAGVGQAPPLTASKLRPAASAQGNTPGSSCRTAPTPRARPSGTTAATAPSPHSAVAPRKLESLILLPSQPDTPTAMACKPQAAAGSSAATGSCSGFASLLLRQQPPAAGRCSTGRSHAPPPLYALAELVEEAFEEGGGEMLAAAVGELQRQVASVSLAPAAAAGDAGGREGGAEEGEVVVARQAVEVEQQGGAGPAAAAPPPPLADTPAALPAQRSPAAVAAMAVQQGSAYATATAPSVEDKHPLARAESPTGASPRPAMPAAASPPQMLCSNAPPAGAAEAAAGVGQGQAAAAAAAPRPTGLEQLAELAAFAEADEEEQRQQQHDGEEPLPPHPLTNLRVPRKTRTTRYMLHTEPEGEEDERSYGCLPHGAGSAAEASMGAMRGAPYRPPSGPPSLPLFKHAAGQQQQQHSMFAFRPRQQRQPGNGGQRQWHQQAMEATYDVAPPRRQQQHGVQLQPAPPLELRRPAGHLQQQPLRQQLATGAMHRACLLLQGMDAQQGWGDYSGLELPPPGGATW